MKRYYLDTMGIEQWTLRNRQAPSQPCYGLQLIKDGKLCGVLLAASSCKDQKIRELLFNISRALKMEVKGEWYSCTPDLSAVINDCRFVIMMGNFSNSFDNIPTIKTHSPERLLSEPQLKRQAWDDLQKVFSFMDS